MNQSPNDRKPVFRRGLLSVLVPAYNERAYLRTCVNRILDAPLPSGLKREIVIVDDASTDGTDQVIAQLVEENPEVIRAYRQAENQGKGAAVKRAVEEMRGQYAIIQDADLEYDPNEYPLLLRPIVEGYADVVYGSRFTSTTMRRVFNYHHALGNKFLTHLSNMTTGLNLTDMETCYKAFRSDVLKTIPIRSKRFGIEPEITAKIAKRGCVVYEVPVSYRGRSYNEGKKIGWKDGFSAIHTILKFWLLDDCFEERYGQSILHSLSSVRRLHAWMVSRLAPHMGERILEVGSGIGNVSRHLPKREKTVVTDMDPAYLEILDGVFDGNDLVDVAQLDINSDEDVDALGRDVCDTIVCLNVLEHIEDDVAALTRLRRLLPEKGRLLLLVPQYQWLYGSYDRAVDHYRRYNRKTLSRCVESAGYSVVKFESFNFMPMFGWWLNSCLLNRTTMDRWQLKVFDMLIPVLRPLERILPLPGISLICVAEKKDIGDA